MSVDRSTLEQSAEVPLDTGPAFQADRHSFDETQGMRRSFHLFEDCTHLDDHATTVEQYDTVEDLPRERWLGTTGPLYPKPCPKCVRRYRGGSE